MIDLQDATIAQLHADVVTLKETLMLQEQRIKTAHELNKTYGELVILQRQFIANLQAVQRLKRQGSPARCLSEFGAQPA